MTSVADLVRVMHDIDVYKDRICVLCAHHFWNIDGKKRWIDCRKGYANAGPLDGCDDWEHWLNSEHAA